MNAGEKEEGSPLSDSVDSVRENREGSRLHLARHPGHDLPLSLDRGPCELDVHKSLGRNLKAPTFEAVLAPPMALSEAF